MSTSPLVQRPANSVDDQGISLVTATRSASDPRLGVIYHPDYLAAATPIFFHPTAVPDTFVAVFSRRYTSGTLSETNPSLYSDWTEDTVPSWALIHSTSGAVTAIGGSFTIPMNKANDSRVVEAACSRPPSYLYLLNTVTNGATDTAVIQHFHISPQNGINILAEETMPTLNVNGQDVLFNRGVFYSNPHIIVIGAGLTDHAIYLARKEFGWIGPYHSWQYQTDRGWSTHDSEIDPVKTSTGTPITTVGSCSAVIYKNRTLISTVQASDTARTAVVYQQNGLTWRPTGDAVSLGTAGSTYLGGLYLQQQLRANPDSAVLADQSRAAGFPYVVNQLSTVGDESGIDTQWNLLPISRLT